MKIAASSAAVLLGALTPALAQYASPPPYAVAPRYEAVPQPDGVLPPYEVMTIVRSMGFDPITRPVLRGPIYVVRALDEENMPVRVAVDARSGNVLRVTEGGPYAPGNWQAARAGAYMVPQETVPPSAAYSPPRDIDRQVAPPPQPKVAARTPLPRPAPPHTKPAAPSPGLAALPDPKATPGKSVPAPVANHGANATAAAASPAKPDPTAKSADHEAITGTTTSPNSATSPATIPELKLVPVAPLE
ncbi:MAG: hypothetical protein ACXWJW_07820 [Xanthobacteraceae bacterium]